MFLILKLNFLSSEIDSDTQISKAGFTLKLFQIYCDVTVCY